MSSTSGPISPLLPRTREYPTPQPFLAKKALVSHRRLSMIQLTKSALVCSCDVEKYAHEFEQKHTLRLSQLLDPEVLRMVFRAVEEGKWISFEHGTIARELC